MSLDKYLIKQKRKTLSESDDEHVEKKSKLEDIKTRTADQIPNPLALNRGSKDYSKEPKAEQNDKTADLDQDAVIRNSFNEDHSESPGVVKSMKSDLKWRKLKAENLDCDYVQLYSAKEANALLSQCEKQLDYNTGQLAMVQIFGKWRHIPRKQVAHGDAGLTYTFSGKTVPARPWLPFLTSIRNTIEQLTGHDFNFVLINRYKDGHDHVGEHKDDEKDLVHGHPIASLSLGQPRDFVFKHQDARGKNASHQVPLVKIELQNGGLLMMNHPTNSFWYHSLPQRKKLHGVRINMTFRKMVGKKK